MKTELRFLMILSFGAIAFVFSCTKDKGPYIFEFEICDCDTSQYRDCWCDSTQPLRPVPCLCDTTAMRDCYCDTLDPKPACDCDSSLWRDCDCDTWDLPKDCGCDTSAYHDCWCDTYQPDTCRCDITPFRDCYCDSLQPPKPVISYKKDIQPIWDFYCTSCHDENDALMDLTTEYSYAYIINKYVEEDNPAESEIYKRVIGIGNIMPPTAPFLTKKEKQLILDWIKLGVENN